jgi:hypothetical protein
MFRHGTIVSAVVLTGAALLVAPGMATATESPSPSYPPSSASPSPTDGTESPTQPSPPPRLPKCTNCTEVHKLYPNGVGRHDAVDEVQGDTIPDTTFTVDDELYRELAKRGLDRDHDGIACEVPGTPTEPSETPSPSTPPSTTEPPTPVPSPSEPAAQPPLTGVDQPVQGEVRVTG